MQNILFQNRSPATGKGIVRTARRFSTIWIEPDAFLRYLPVIRWIKRHKPLKVLEIGSGDFGLSTYLKYPVVKLDLKFNRPSRGSSFPIAADATTIPFENNSFDFVFAVDLLEHVSPEWRGKVVEEMVRVSQDCTLAVFPCGKDSWVQDHELSLLFEKERGEELAILRVHEKTPFPEENEILQWVRPISSKIESWHLQKSFNLSLREKLIRGWLRQTPWVYRAIEWFLMFPSIFMFFHFGRCYRRILSIKIRRECQDIN